MVEARGGVAKRILARTVVKGDCWEWTGGVVNTGYGLTSVSGRRWLTHRLAHELWIGPIPESFEVDHLCRNRVCLNPDHLEAVSKAVNMRRAWAANRMSACRRGHAFTPENTFFNGGFRGCRTCRRLREKGELTQSGGMS